jgi:predicted TIM-barrel fold metal-dependent hydrolase
MRLDGHIHIHEGPVDPQALRRRMADAGMDGGVLLSLPPSNFKDPGAAAVRGTEQRLDHLLSWARVEDRLFPFFWIDPIAPDALAQVGAAVRRGVMGFKVICDRFPAADERALQTFQAIADAGRPMLFHSGILWDGKPSSGFNHPSAFEALLDVRGLRFALAHIGWPWCDEMIAVYGKFLNAFTTRKDLSVEMFIDTTPGTPPVYRRDALTKLFTVGYDVENNVIFGSDCSTDSYNAPWTQEWLDRDTAIFNDLGVAASVQAKIFGGNLRRFLGLSREKVGKKLLRSGE